jgi:hypothetical protein
MNPRSSLVTLRALAGIVALFLALGCQGDLRAAPSTTNAAPAITTSTSAELAKAAAELTNAAASSALPNVTTISDDDDDSGGKRHSAKIVIDTGHSGSTSVWSDIADDLIPLTGILATFGMPVLVVFVVAYFNFRRRRENMALAREYLNKGLPVPQELLDTSRRGVDLSRSMPRGYRCDLNRGFKLTFIGFGVTLALFITSPHSTHWAWGLIPLVMGIGYLLSAWIEARGEQRDRPGSPLAPPPDERR